MMAKRNLTLKLLVDKENQKVLFAEAGKEVVDFLFSLLALPVGTVASLLAANGMEGSIGELYGSLQRLDGSYVQAGFNKSTLLKPMVPSNTSCKTTFPLERSESTSSSKTFYKCDGRSYNDGGFIRQCTNSPSYVTDCAGVPCPGCKRPMTVQLAYVPPKPEMAAAGAGEGYVKGVVTYMVMDDLAVEPMSAISCITLLNRFHIREVSSLEERTVELALEEGLALLKAAFRSKTVLSDVFVEGTVWSDCASDQAAGCPRSSEPSSDSESDEEKAT